MKAMRVLAVAALVGALAGCSGSSDPLAGLDLPSSSAAPVTPPHNAPARQAARHHPGPGATTPVVGAPSAPIATTAPAPAPQIVKPVPVVCPPLPDSGAAGSHLVFGGACPFVETRALPCPNNPQNPDDYYIRFTRAMKNHLTMYISINVEHFKGPGDYPGQAVIIIEIPDNSTIYEWSTNTGSATIGADRRSGSLPRQDLPPDVGTPTHGTETVEGTFRCSP